MNYGTSRGVVSETTMSSQSPTAPQHPCLVHPGLWLLTRKNMRCWSPFPESLLRLPRRMNSCGWTEASLWDTSPGPVHGSDSLSDCAVCLLQPRCQASSAFLGILLAPLTGEETEAPVSRMPAQPCARSPMYTWPSVRIMCSLPRAYTLPPQHRPGPRKVACCWWGDLPRDPQLWLSESRNPFQGKRARGRWV